MHPGASARGRDDDQRKLLWGGALDEPGEPLSDDAPHAPHDERRIGDAAGHPPGPDHAGAGKGRVRQTGPLLLGHKPLGVRFLVAKTERICRTEAGVPFLEGPGVAELLDPGRRRDIPVESALRADIEDLLRFLAVDRLLAAVTFLPQPFGYPPFRPRRPRRRGCRGGGGCRGRLRGSGRLMADRRHLAGGLRSGGGGTSFHATGRGGNETARTEVHGATLPGRRVSVVACPGAVLRRSRRPRCGRGAGERSKERPPHRSGAGWRMHGGNQQVRRGRRSSGLGQPQPSAERRQGAGAGQQSDPGGRQRWPSRERGDGQLDRCGT